MQRARLFVRECQDLFRKKAFSSSTSVELTIFLFITINQVKRVGNNFIEILQIWNFIDWGGRISWQSVKKKIFSTPYAFVLLSLLPYTTIVLQFEQYPELLSG